MPPPCFLPIVHAGAAGMRCRTSSSKRCRLAHRAALRALLPRMQSLARQMSQLDLGLQGAAAQYLQVFDAAGGLVHHAKAATMVTMDFMSSAGGWADGGRQGQVAGVRCLLVRAAYAVHTHSGPLLLAPLRRAGFVVQAEPMPVCRSVRERLSRRCARLSAPEHRSFPSRRPLQVPTSRCCRRRA
jgi:hypothetical protein